VNRKNAADPAVYEEKRVNSCTGRATEKRPGHLCCEADAERSFIRNFQGKTAQALLLLRIRNGTDGRGGTHTGSEGCRVGTNAVEDVFFKKRGAFIEKGPS